MQEIVDVFHADSGTQQTSRQVQRQGRFGFNLRLDMSNSAQRIVLVSIHPGISLSPSSRKFKSTCEYV